MAAPEPTHALIITDDPEGEPELVELYAPDELPRRAVFVILGEDTAEMRAWGRLWQASRRERAQAQTLIDALSPERVLGPAATEQLRLNALARSEFLDQHEVLTSAEVAEFVGSSAQNRNAAAHKLARKGRLFAVRYKGRDFYPAFQFDRASGTPRPELMPVFEVLAAAGLRGWEIAFWLVEPNGWLPHDHSPLQVLAEDPEAVVEAARHEAEVPF
jgi:hypothetical protein